MTTDLKSLFRVLEHKNCQFSKNVLISRGVFIKLFMSNKRTKIVARLMCSEKLLYTNHQLLV